MSRFWSTFKLIHNPLKDKRNKKDEIKSTCQDLKCSKCGNTAAKIEIVEPNAYPKDAVNWNIKDYELYEKYRDFSLNYLLYTGPGGSNGYIGDPIDLNRKKAIIDAFTKPYNSIKIRQQFYDMAGFCTMCNKFYCSKHWHTTTSEYGKCPEGHHKSLDPHWSPDIE
ncbi:hypothetical protein [Salegentibacter maritimus]|uniref:Uncharacterized protein n=1 Tax=Salegentibacter maritimus TaxID=2794347 RepID=A0ABS0TCK8_9FLAO|nr:hypothetical protein [Salegentibacter maritimus]MBI6118775.1 hypothetical protein [Salegentibacter maritimus]